MNDWITWAWMAFVVAGSVGFAIIKAYADTKTESERHRNYEQYKNSRNKMYAE